MAITLFFHYTKEMLTLLYLKDITGTDNKIHKIYFVSVIFTTMGIYELNIGNFLSFALLLFLQNLTIDFRQGTILI